jgi:hypothetical protein
VAVRSLPRVYDDRSKSESAGRGGDGQARREVDSIRARDVRESEYQSSKKRNAERLRK